MSISICLSLLFIYANRIGGLIRMVTIYNNPTVLNNKAARLYSL